MFFLAVIQHGAVGLLCKMWPRTRGHQLGLEVSTQAKGADPSALGTQVWCVRSLLLLAPCDHSRSRKKGEAGKFLSSVSASYMTEDPVPFSCGRLFSA